MSAPRHMADPGAVEAAARAMLGTPFVHRASHVRAGCDCLGLARAVWRAVVGPEPPLPPYPPAGPADPGALIAGLAARMIPLAAPAPGALVVVALATRAGPRHCGVLTTCGTLIHAVPGRGVVEVAWGPAFARRLAAAFAFPAGEGG